MNPWRHGSLQRNPYYRTAFRVARVPREIVRHRTLVQMIGQTKRVVSTHAQAHNIQGEPVTEAALNTAEKILVDPRRRILEELLEHAAEKAPLDRIQELARAAALALAPDEAATPTGDDLAGLLPLVDQIVESFLDTAPGNGASFGALELGLVPPFGPLGDP